jgi:hypothetical protein
MLMRDLGERKKDLGSLFDSQGRVQSVRLDSYLETRTMSSSVPGSGLPKRALTA